MKVKIGTWIEREARDITQCPGSYAADSETLRTRPGRYDLFVTVEGGYNYPMPYWLVVRIDADRIAGTTYSGFGGHNFASQALPKAPKPYCLQTWVYQLRSMIEKGNVELLPEWQALNATHEQQLAFAATLEWGKGLLSREEA